MYESINMTTDSITGTLRYNQDYVQEEWHNINTAGGHIVTLNIMLCRIKKTWILFLVQREDSHTATASQQYNASCQTDFCL